MRVLFISDRNPGGIVTHVRTLLSCLRAEGVECYAIGEDEPFAGTSGHDWREWAQIRRLVKTFKPQVIHFHIPNLVMAFYARFFTRCKIVCSWHTPTSGKMRSGERLFCQILGKRGFYLPVSRTTYEGMERQICRMKGEVFYNPLQIGTLKAKTRQNVVGMVGRNAQVKDWPSFHRVVDILGVEGWNIGEEMIVPNARDKIGEMALYLLTSFSEEMPTVVLECFAERTPICGFIPKGGMKEILSYSNGALKEVFIEDRDCTKLAEIARRILGDRKLQERLVEDGWQILTNHFDAEKNCRGQLMDIYRRIVR